MAKITTSHDGHHSRSNLAWVGSGINQNFMVKMKVKGDWNVIKGKLKQQFGNLTDDDLMFVKGKEEELLGRLQRKLGKTKQELRDLIGKL